MLSPQFVNAKELRQEIGNLNKAGVLKEKIKAVGVKKEELVKSFLDAIDSIPEGSEEEKKIPESTIKFYNDIVQGEDPSEEEQAKMKEKKAKPKKEKVPSNHAIMNQMLKNGASDEEIEEVFMKRYADKGQTDKDFVLGRIKIYKDIESRKIAEEKGEKPEKKTKTKAKKEKATEETAEETTEEATE